MSGARALITGITGQDGSYLAEFLLDRGYEVHGLVRRSSAPNLERLSQCAHRLHLHHGDLLDLSSLIEVLKVARPTEIYNLAAQSFVPTSWQQPTLTGEFTALGVTRLLEAVRILGLDARFYQASSSEMFGKVRASPQDETTPFYPRSPYGVSKVYGHFITVNYRESYGLFACSGIMFNHESPRRGREFVTRKICEAAVAIKNRRCDELVLGNLDARRDWGWAPDYVEAMWQMLQLPAPDDFVIATGISHSVRDVVDIAFKHLGLDPAKYVRSDAELLRPAEVDHLVGDASKAARILGWKPRLPFEEMIVRMVNVELARFASLGANAPWARPCVP